MPNRQLLVIGSDNLINESFRDWLGSMEYSVVSTADIDNGLRLLQETACDIVIACISGVPEENLDNYRQLKTHNAAGEIVVIAGAGEKEAAMDVFGERAWSYLVEPVTGDELKAAVKRIVRFAGLDNEVSVTTKRVLYLEVINDIAREVLLSDDSDSLLRFIAKEIYEKLGFSNVNIFIIDNKYDHAVLKASAGDFGALFAPGFTLKIGEGIVGWSALKRTSQYSGDVKNFPHRIQAFDFEEDIQSELAVPIMFENGVLGVIHVESLERDAFSHDDIIVLETLADQISLALEKIRLSQELRESYELSAVINDILPVSILIMNSDFIVEYVNKTFCEVSNRSCKKLLNHSVRDVLNDEMFGSINIQQNLTDVLEHGHPVNYHNVRHTSPNHPGKMLNVTIVQIRGGDHPLVMILIQEITEITQKTYQLLLLREISIAMQGVLERDKLLHLILTCVTAGFAIGFNRAFIFLVDDSQKLLRGYMGVGPKTREEAYQIWNDLSEKKYTFQEYLDSIHQGHIERSGLQDLIENMIFDCTTESNILIDTVESRQFIHVMNAWENSQVDESMRQFVTNEFVSIPLIARNQVIGVLIADNAYSGRYITRESIEVLTMFAAHAGLAIENSRILMDLEDKVNELRDAYIELEKTHDMLVRNEKLAAIGEVSARIAHEIRNPLSTIGGFAKSIPGKYDDRERTIRNANIIVDEVERLETILANILDFSKPGVPKKSVTDINRLIEETLLLLQGDVISDDVCVTLDLPEKKLEANIDSSQIKQVLINIIKNSINALEGKGSIKITASACDNEAMIVISDSGVGIPDHYIENIIEPFFTTRGDGTGLGLSISNHIIQNHHGRFEIISKEGKGTTVRIILPLHE